MGLLCMGRRPRWPSVFSLAFDDFEERLDPFQRSTFAKSQNTPIYEWLGIHLVSLAALKIEVHEGKFTIMQDAHHY